MGDDSDDETVCVLDDEPVTLWVRPSAAVAPTMVTAHIVYQTQTTIVYEETDVTGFAARRASSSLLGEPRLPRSARTKLRHRATQLLGKGRKAHLRRGPSPHDWEMSWYKTLKMEEETPKMEEEMAKVEMETTENMETMERMQKQRRKQPQQKQAQPHEWKESRSKEESSRSRSKEEACS